MLQLSPNGQSRLSRHFTYGICAIALVGSLSIYQQSVLGNPLTVAQHHWEAIAQDNVERTLSHYSADATLSWHLGSLERFYQGPEISLIWQQFFNKYQIQKYRLLRQDRNTRSVQAEITLVPRLKRDSIHVIVMFYEAEFDEQGKITREVWRTDPGLNV